jgi:hypothetical protein
MWGDFVRCEIARCVSAISPSFTFADLAPAAYGFSVRSCVTIQREQSSRLEHADALAQAPLTAVRPIVHEPPVHQTDSNCWVCGRFTANDHITKIDEGEGWQTAIDGAVTCSNACRAKKPGKAAKAFAKSSKKPARK